MTECDFCEIEFELSDLFNVDYIDSGYANVLCAGCVELLDTPADVWQA